MDLQSGEVSVPTLARYKKQTHLLLLLFLKVGFKIASQVTIELIHKISFIFACNFSEKVQKKDYCTAIFRTNSGLG